MDESWALYRFPRHGLPSPGEGFIFILRVLRYSVLLFILTLQAEEEVFSQTKADYQPAGIADIAEELAASGYSEQAIGEVVEDLQFLLLHPINLNQLTEEDLNLLHVLSENQIRSLLLFSQSLPVIQTVYELQYVEGFSPELLARIAPFFRAGPKERKTPYSAYEQMTHVNLAQLQVKWKRVKEKSAGYDLPPTDDRAFQGCRDYLSLKTQVGNASKWRLGLNLEKDAGEQLMAKNMPVDFSSFFLEVKRLGPVDYLVVGDFRTQMGQGLICGPGFGLSKMADNPLLISQRGSFARPHTSTDELRFFRGAAILTQWGRMEAGMFFSHRKVDAGLDTVAIQDEVEFQVSSMPETGLHRNISELEKRKNILRNYGGGRLRYNGTRTSFGLNYLIRADEYQTSPTQAAPYQFHMHEEGVSQNASLDYRFSIPKGTVFGELASDKEGNTASLLGFLVNPFPEFGFSMLARNYDMGYFAPLASAFGENSTASNESGVFAGLDYQLSAAFRLSGFCDFFWFPWLKYGVSAPSKGQEFGIQLGFSRRNGFRTYLRAKVKNKEEDLSGVEQGMPQLTETRKISVRYHVEYPLGDQLQGSNRLEWLAFDPGTQFISEGFLLFQDLRWSILSDKGMVAGRLSFFEANSYDARLYVFESDLPDEFSVVALTDQGMRFYLLFRYNLSDHWACWIRLGQSFYSNRTSIGSGLDEIPGSTKTDVKCMFRYRF